MESETLDCDFVIIGAGSSGCVLASRLVRRGLKVLLVEKGTTDPGKLRRLVLRQADWIQLASQRGPLLEQFITVPQTNLHNRRLHAMRGRGGGGSSNINACLYSRGRQEDYEGHWPWKLEDIKTSFESIEAELTLEEGQSTSSIMPSWERILLEAGCERASLEGEEAASDSHGDIVDNKITWTKLGLGGCPNISTTRRGGERQSAWATFVAPITSMPNLRIKSDATVSRVIIERGRAVGIEVLEHVPTLMGGRTRLRQLRLAREAAEIVLCCGVFRTPKLLMLSGVGPKEHLEDKGVPVLVDMPQVGANLQDHLVAPILQFSKVPLTPADYCESSIHGMVYIPCPPCPPVPGESKAVTNASSSSADIDASVGASPAVLGFMFFDGQIFYTRILSNIRLNNAHPGLMREVMNMLVTILVWVVLHLTPLGWLVRRSRPVFLLLTSTKSRGTMRLASRDPSCPPVIDPAYLSHPDDERVVAKGWQTLRRAKTETAMAKTLLGYDVLPGKMFNYGLDDKSFIDYFKRASTPFFHPVGTCRMGQGPEDSVVSADSLRVHGVAGLRVADASVAPRIPSVPTQAMAMMIGDRASAIVLGDMTTKGQVKARMFEAASKSVN